MNTLTIRAMAALLCVLGFLPLGARAHDGTPAPISRTEGSSRVEALSAGIFHICGLKADGSVDCWGASGVDYGQAADQAGPFVSVSAGWYHSCGLKTDGSVDCWGGDGGFDYGQAADQAGPFVSVSAGWYHSCGLKADGSVECWGGDGGFDYGQVAGQAGPFISVSAGGAHTCGLKADGSVNCWGGAGGFDFGQTTDQAGPFVSVSAGGVHSCGLKADGSVDCWGANAFDFSQAADQVGPFVSVSAGPFHTCGLKADGSVDCWGAIGFDYGQAADQAGPFVSVSAGEYATCGLKADGSVDCWGGGNDTDYGQLAVPVDLGPPGFGQIAAGNAHACQATRDGTLACWGDNSEGQTDAPAGLFTQVVAGDSNSCAIGSDGRITCWGLNGTAITANGNLSVYRWRQLAPASNGNVCALAATPLAGCTAGGSVLVGSGGGTRYITHPKGNSYSPGMVRDTGVGLMDPGFDAAHTGFFEGPWQRLESGLNHQCGLKADGSVECWGDTLTDGQLDNLPAATDRFRALSVGYNHACAIRETGELACWGSNINGQATPPTGSFVQVAAGNTFTCGIRDSGIRVCWGSDAAGQAPQLTLSPGLLPPGGLNAPYTGAQFVLADGAPDADGDYVPPTPAFAVVAGALPGGLTLGATGELTGTPTDVGSFMFTIEAEDANGFTASREYTIAIADGSPPQISYMLDPATPDGDNGWYVSDVGIDWTVTDAESGISDSTGCEDTTLASDTLGATFTCTATSGGGTSTVTTTTLKRDATAPTLAPTVPDPILRDGTYAASPNAADATSGLLSASCEPLDTGSTGSKSVDCTATDNAGNMNMVSLNYTVTTTCANDGYTGAKLTWCRNICENGLTGQVLDTWIHRWIQRYRTLPYCRIDAQ